MIAEIISALTSLGGAVLPFTVIDQWQKGVILRFGRFHKELGPGLWWKIPLVDVLVAHCVAATTTSLSAQSIRAPDGVTYTIEGVVKWYVSDIRPYVTDIYDGEGVVMDSSKSAVADVVIKDGIENLGSKVSVKARAALKKYGIYVDTVTITTLVSVRCIRIISDRAFAPEVR